MALYIAGIGTSYQVFVGGRLIGQFGGLPPHQRALFEFFGASTVPHDPPLGSIFPIPSGISDRDGSLVVTIRVWIWPDFAPLYNAQTFRALRIGDVCLLNDERQHKWNYEFWSVSAPNALLLGYLIAALAGLGLFALRPGEVEYLWFAAVELISAAINFWNIWPGFHPEWYQPYLAVIGFFVLSAGICTPIFYVTLLKQPRSRLFWSSIGSSIFVSLLFVPVVGEWMSAPTWFGLIYLAGIPAEVCQFLILYLPARRGILDARLLLAPVGLQYGTALGGGLILGLYATGHGGPIVAFLAGKWDQLVGWPFPISVQNVADFLCQISLLAILMLRFARTRRDEERFKSELEAGRAAQRILVPEELAAVEGYTIQSAYVPAGNLSGDFFQVIPAKSGGALLALGDVSGKGLNAAMKGTLAIGAMRTLASEGLGPAELLARLNEQVTAAKQDGFITLICALAAADGTVSVANAGHLHPYLNGKEIVAESGFPLGLWPRVTYPETKLRLSPGDRLTFLSDGVLEARSVSGELFGFERVQAISNRPPTEIAEIAQHFGQDDDITVLTVTRLAAEQAAAVRLSNFSPEPV